MRPREFWLDRKYLIIFFLLLMSFVTAVIYLDPAVKVWKDDIIYMNLVTLLLFLLYLLGSYLTRKKYYQEINRIIQNGNGAIISGLPENHSYEQKLVNHLLMKMYAEQNDRLEKIHLDKKNDFEFISTWVHEIKTPIAVSHLIIENNRGSGNDELLNSLQEEVDRIDRLVEQVLYYSKVDDFSRDYFINEIDLKKLVNEVIKKHARTFIHKHISIELGNLDIEIRSDQKWLRFMLDQIISNSLKYTGQGGLIQIQAEGDEWEKRLIIMDNGIGIKEEDLARVFDRGFTGYNGRVFMKSTGMGLYLTDQLARKLGHAVIIDSVYGEYTRVTIRFPKLGDYYMNYRNSTE